MSVWFCVGVPVLLQSRKTLQQNISVDLPIILSNHKVSMRHTSDVPPTLEAEILFRMNIDHFCSFLHFGSRKKGKIFIYLHSIDD